MIVGKNLHTSFIVGKNLPTPKPQRGDSLRTRARRLLRMGRKDVEQVVIDLLEDTDEVTLQDLDANKLRAWLALQDPHNLSFSKNHRNVKRS